LIAAESPAGPQPTMAMSYISIMFILSYSV
jgi:hypothetical protein